MSLSAKAFIWLVALQGCLGLAESIGGWHSSDLVRGVVYCMMAVFASGIKLYLPGITSTISPGFVLILFGIVSLDLPTVLTAGVAGILVQYFWRTTRRPRPVQVLFNIGNISIAVLLSYALFHSPWLDRLSLEKPVKLALAGSAYFILTTLPVASAVALTEGKSLIQVWKSHRWMFPFYLLGAGVAGVLGWVQLNWGWQSSLLAVPAIYFVYRGYRTHLERLEEDRHREQLRLEKERAEAGDRAKSEFLAMMSHEIRTPMNGILGMAQVLQNSDLCEEHLDHVNALYYSAEALLTIINDILDFSKIEAGKLTMETIPFDLLRLIEDTLDGFGDSAAKKAIDLIVNIAPDAPRRVLGDSGRIRQVLVNLVGNAIKFTTQGHVAVDVTWEPAPEQRARLRFSVTDTGIGISKEKLDALFRPFTQADASTTRKFGGTGLGLAICKKLVEMMQGSMGVESESEKGSTFWFTLELPLPDTTEVAITQPLSGMRILLVDESEATRSGIGKQIQAWGAACMQTHQVDAVPGLIRNAQQEGMPFDVLVVQKRDSCDGNLRSIRVQVNGVVYRTPQVHLVSRARRVEPEHKEDSAVVFLDQPITPSKLLDALRTCRAAPAEGDKAVGVNIPRRGQRTTAGYDQFDARVLVAEDNSINQRLARFFLEQFGCKVDLAGNGREAIRLALLGGYDMIFMDCLMPEVDGFAATRELRYRMSGATPIIAFTAGAMEGDRQQCLAAGMTDYISKPVKPEDLAGILAQYIPNRQIARSNAG